MYKCKYCNKEFDKKQQLGGHIIHCDLNPNKSTQNNLENYNKHRELYNNQRDIKYINNSCEITQCECIYCGKMYTLFGIKTHERYCKLNPNREICVGNRGHTVGYSAWNKGLNKTTDKRILKSCKTLRKRYENGELVNQYKGKHLTDEHKKHIREGTIRYLQQNEGFSSPRFNVNACKYIDMLNEKRGWKLQHALNGGEYYIDGYFIDGYDKDKNIVFEYDEETHYIDPLTNSLKEKDIQRQEYIINKLHCEFYRYNEFTKQLYEVRMENKP